LHLQYILILNKKDGKEKKKKNNGLNQKNRNRFKLLKANSKSQSRVYQCTRLHNYRSLHERNPAITITSASVKGCIYLFLPRKFKTIKAVVNEIKYKIT
jgi:hypothetical protein